ncbi:TPA: VENN motif pre-toxin domain-containing protein, partial [Proteus mirabilis]|nr:VENN motif pre-toxin domain-containing protein [Proteus mirabilis]
LSAHVILNTLFPSKKVSDLTESEKQQVSALSQLASGLAGGLTTGDVAGAITGSQAGKNAVENNALVVPTPAGPIVLPVVIPGTSDTTNEQLALSIERALKNMGKTISDTLSPEDKTQALNDAMKALTPEQQAQLNAQIVAERESNQIALGKPLVKDMNDYLATNETGKFIKEQSKLLGYDNSGNPIYQAVNGAGNFINADDKMKLSGSKDALLVYSKEGVFVSALNLDGSRNDTLTAIYKGGQLSTISDIKISNNTGGNQIPEPLPPLPGTLIPEQNKDDGKLITPIPTPGEVGKNHIGHDGGLGDVEIKTDTGGNQILDKDWRDNVLTSENAENGLGDKNSSVIKINKGQQNKHIEGTNEFKTAGSSGDIRSIINVSPDSLLPKVGTGEQVGNIKVGLPGSKERVDFGKVIGNFVDKDTGQAIPTTRGIVHYGKNGVHIVPSRPK